jgi:hypothetical protein
MAKGPEHPLEITLSTFETVLSRYNEHVKDALQDLDNFRYKALPERLASEEEPALRTDDLTRLVEWKLYASSPVHA